MIVARISASGLASPLLPPSVPEWGVMHDNSRQGIFQALTKG